MDTNEPISRVTYDAAMKTMQARIDSLRRPGPCGHPMANYEGHTCYECLRQQAAVNAAIGRLKVEIEDQVAKTIQPVIITGGNVRVVSPRAVSITVTNGNVFFETSKNPRPNDPVVPFPKADENIDLRQDRR